MNSSLSTFAQISFIVTNVTNFAQVCVRLNLVMLPLIFDLNIFSLIILFLIIVL